MKPTYLIFDFGGVLFHWNPVRLLAQVLPERANTPENATLWKDRFFQGYTGDWGQFDAGLIDEAETVRRIASRTGLAPAEVEAVLAAVPDALSPIPATVALLRRLREAGHRLFFLSNMPAPYAAHLSRTHDFLRGFDDGVFSSEVRLAKPDPAIFALALQRFDIPARSALFIDDHLGNVEAANRFGLPAVLFTDAQRLERDLLARGLRLD
ncbi:HAD family hydrolase [Sphaerotilus microaerophilus]|uniref:Haloacid dehalogenase n=1 Tax=Sphaerotilus microaerophilus TaxID=2914710 RepID=A0ABN6PIC5_9BURK|nr:HAD family phosphatase [Sphaerotilus sp. FB-5]BDI04432.1 haloacid dehalogenase [Sphaerotilus sp. FB-5]